jgi:hypothetical protein
MGEGGIEGGRRVRLGRETRLLQAIELPLATTLCSLSPTRYLFLSKIS